MSIVQVPPSAAVANPVPVTPQTASVQATSDQASQASTPVPTDTVTISKQAQSILANSPGYSPTEETQESAAAKAVEVQKGPR